MVVLPPFLLDAWVAYDAQTVFVICVWLFAVDAIFVAIYDERLEILGIDHAHELIACHWFFVQKLYEFVGFHVISLSNLITLLKGAGTDTGGGRD